MTTRLTTEQIEAIRKRAEKVSDGDWYAEVSTFENATEKLTEIAVQPGVAMSVRTEADAEFIANAREDIPKLLAEVERYKDVERKLRLITDKAYETSDPQLFTILHGIKDALYGGD